MRADRVVALVSGLGAAQSVAIVTQIGATGDAVGGTIFGAGPTAQLVIGLLSSVFLVVAITVTSVVVSGTTEVVLTEQVRRIALRRLLGASATAERARVAREIVRQAAVGMGWGAVIGYVASVGVLAAGFATSSQVRLTAASVIPSPLLILALVAQLIATRAAVARGTQGVLTVAPVEALRTAADADSAVRSGLAVAPRASIATLVFGIALLGVSLLASVRTPLAMLPAVLGGTVSFVGIVSVGTRVVPPVLRVVGRLLPRSLPVTLARRSLEQHPARASRAVLGVAATVTLVTTFAVGITSFEQAVDEHYATSAFAGLAADVLDAVVAVVAVLTAFLAVTAGVALGNAVAFGAKLRRRDTALLRILGQSARDSRTTLLVQSLLLALAATVIGLVLGTAYGWIGAQSVFGVEAQGHVVTPVIPWPLLVGAAVAVGVLTVAASVAPIRAALRQTPVQAYLSPA